MAVILCLLFQQVAVAAYLCPLEAPSVPAVMADCSGVGMEQHQDPQNPALCAKHCEPDIPLATDATALSVPPLALSPAHFTRVLMPSVARATRWAEVPVIRSDPPARVRFCSLLI